RKIVLFRPEVRVNVVARDYNARVPAMTDDIDELRLFLVLQRIQGGPRRSTASAPHQNGHEHEAWCRGTHHPRGCGFHGSLMAGEAVCRRNTTVYSSIVNAFAPVGQ